MTTKIPEALAVLDLFISAYVDGQIPENDQVAIRKARAVFAAEHEALKDARRELHACQAVIYLRGGFDPAYVVGAKAALEKSDKALAAVEKLNER